MLIGVSVGGLDLVCTANDGGLSIVGGPIVDEGCGWRVEREPSCYADVLRLQIGVVEGARLWSRRRESAIGPAGEWRWRQRR